MNKNSLSRYVVFFVLLLGLSSCEAIGAIFKAGVWSGMLLVVLVIALIIFIITRLGNRNK
jgi:TRAP-type C4-dicarboxylate transport system permease large subunit